MTSLRTPLNLRKHLLAGVALLTIAPAAAQETVTYTYDNKGRVHTVTHSGTVNNNLAASYTYDNADNRTNVTVSGAGAAALSITTASPLPGGTAGSAYSAQIQASGGSGGYTFTASGLPSWLSLNGSTGVLSGTTATAGTYSFTITANDSAGNTASKAYSLTIAAATTCSGVSFAVGNASANEGSNLSFTVTESGTTSNSCSVSYGTADVSAKAGTNYTAKTGSLTFAAPGSQTVTVSTIDDHVITGALTMNLKLSNPSGSASISTGTGTGTINNIDSSGTTTTIQLASGTSENLRTIANANGYAGSSSANYTFIVGSGVTITGSAGSGIGIDTGSWPAGVTLALQVNGIVRGGGGNGGNGASATWNGTSQNVTPATSGGAGGDAVRCSVPIAITVNSGGTVQAGGGGGGGGGASAQAGGPSGAPGADIPGGGGGGGAPNGAGGAPGTGYNASGTAGSPGTTSGGGNPGGGIPGGPGGSYGAAGIAGGSSGLANGGSGGAAGYAVRKNGTSCSATNSGGTITGTVG